MTSYTSSCVCGNTFDNNCAHFLSNWMINNNKISKNPSGCYCCKEGRPIRAKEMRNVFTSMGLTKKFNPPKKKDPKTKKEIILDCYIYCERNSDHQGHVYYGQKGKCVAGTGDGSFGADYYEYYF